MERSQEEKGKCLKEQGVPAFIAPTPQPPAKPATPQEILERHEAEIAEIKATLAKILGQLEVLIGSPQPHRSLTELKIKEALRKGK